MYPFSQSVTPAIRSHLDAQTAFFNDLSKSLSRSFQNLCELNIQLSQTLLEEGSTASQQFLTMDHPGDGVAVAAARAQPSADKLRAYQQHIARVVADAQMDLAQVTEQHSPVTSRTARDLADKVAKVAVEETEKYHQTQKEMINNFRDPFQALPSARANGSVSAQGNMQSAEPGQHGDHAQGASEQAAGKPNAKPV